MVNEWLVCRACEKKFNSGGDLKCPFCGSERIEVFGDAEDVDATTNDYTDQFKQEGVQSGLLGSGMKEVRSDIDFNDRGVAEELKPPEDWQVDAAKIPDILLPDILE